MYLPSYTDYMNRNNRTDKAATEPPVVSKRVLDQVRERIRYLHYSLKTKKAYLYWVGFLCCGLPNRVPCGIRATWEGC